MRRFWISGVMVVGLLLVLLTGTMVAGAQEAVETCTPQTVAASFGTTEDMDLWLEEMMAGDCSLRIKNAAQAMASAYNAMAPVEFGPFPYAALEQSLTEDGYPMLGAAAAPMSIAMYESFGCGYCAQFSDDQFQEMLANVEAGEINVTFVPVTNQFSVVPSAASFCALEQDMFWEMHDIMFDLLQNYGETAFEPNRVLLAAEDLGLEMEGFLACMNGNAVYEGLDAGNMAFGELSETYEGVTGTPTITFNGEPPEFGSGMVPLEYIQAEIAAALEG